MTITIKAILPKRINYTAAIKASLDAMFRRVGHRLRSELLQPTANWKNKPQFQIRLFENGVLVYTEDEHYVWTNNGTNPHQITARNVPRLAFQKNWRASTSPRSLNSGIGMKYGSWRRPYSVMHPGTAARYFTEVVAAMEELRWPQEVQDAISKGSA